VRAAGTKGEKPWWEAKRGREMGGEKTGDLERKQEITLRKEEAAYPLTRRE